MVETLLVHTPSFQSGAENFAIWGCLFGDKGSNSEVSRDSSVGTRRIRKGEKGKADALGKLLLLLCAPHAGSSCHRALEKGRLSLQDSCAPHPLCKQSGGKSKFEGKKLLPDQPSLKKKKAIEELPKF